MVGANVRAETMSLMESRKSIEDHMDQIISLLTAPGAPGIHGSLVDSEGFPLPDIDIGAVRANRQRLAMLRNDHKDITAKIDHNLQILFSGGQTHPGPQSLSDKEKVGQEFTLEPSSFENFPIPMDEDISLGLPFAEVDEIFEGSPASIDGLRLGDQIMKFGTVDSGENLVSRLAIEGQSNQGIEVPVVVLRQGVRVHLKVTPRQWSGHGLLGCHLQIL